MPNLRTLSVNLGLSVASLLLFVLAIEFGLRITGLQTVAPNPPRIYERHPNPSISYRLKANLKREPAYKAHVSTNSLGMRSTEPGKLPKGIVIGDSIAFGYGVEDDQTLSAQLEQKEPEWQWLNMAVPGYQLQQQQALYREIVQPLHPQKAVLVFFWNDLDGLKPGILDDDGILRGADWKPSDDNRNWLEKRSAFYIAFRKLMSLKHSIETQKEQRNTPQKDPVETLHLENYLTDLKAFSRWLPSNRYFVIWPDNFFHTETRPVLIQGAKQAGFTVIDLYEEFGNTVETLGWDTVHPSAEALKKASQVIHFKLQ